MGFFWESATHLVSKIPRLSCRIFFQVASNPNLMEARRRNTLSKMKGLVIPENGTSVDESPAGKGVVTLTTPPWKAVNGGSASGAASTLPKYSPAFKRKPFTIYTSENQIVSKSVDQQQQQPPPTVTKGMFPTDNRELATWNIDNFFF